TKVKYGVHTSLCDGEESHRFRKSIDRRSPLLTKQEKNRGNQCARVTDSDPPNKVEDVDAPRDRNVHAPKADTYKNQVDDRQQHQLEKRKGNRKAKEPRQRSSALQNNRADLVGNRCERQTRIDNRV